MESPSDETCFTCGMPCREGHRCPEERIREAMRAAFQVPARQSDLGDEWLFDVISRLKSVELTKQQALELIAAITASARR